MTSELDIAPAPPAPPGPAVPIGGRRAHWLLDGLRATLPAWLAGHLIVCLVSWHMNPHHPLARLFMWDTRWYLSIANYGYGQPGSLVHFFPLTPATAAAVAAVTRIPLTIALFGVCWLAALFFGALVHRVVVRETGDQASARRAAWLTQLAPGAYALVMGYTEPLAGVLAAGYFLAVRRYPGRGQRWLAAIVLGLLSGVARPTGLLLAIPGAVEGWRVAREHGWRSAVTVKAAAAVVAPGVGLFAFLGFSKLRFHSWALPYTEQTSERNRGHLINNPVHAFIHVWRTYWHGTQVALMALLLILLAAVLIAVLVRRLPLSYAAWTAPSFLLAITSHDFTSLPRYVGALFPVLIVAALLARRRWQEVALLAASSGLLLWTAHTALAGYLVA